VREVDIAVFVVVGLERIGLAQLEFGAYEEIEGYLQGK
jgi:hypothetical protein